MINWLKQHKLISYFFLAYFFSWSVGVPLALAKNGFIHDLPLQLHYLTAYGPMLSAIVVISITEGSRGLKDLFARATQWKLGLGWYVFAFSPIILFIFISVINYLFISKSIDLNLLGQINFLPNLGIFALLLWIFNSGLGEEVGWRGFALPKLQKNNSALRASLILSFFWVGWHLPAFFYLPNYIKLGLTIFPMFALGVTAGAIVYTWLFNSTKGSILLVILFHGVFNFITASKAGEGLSAAVMSTLVIVWAVLIIIFYKSNNLARTPKVIR